MINPAPGTHKDAEISGLDIEEDEILQHISDSELKGKSDGSEMDPDALARQDAVAEAVRQRNDVYLVKTDLEDADGHSSSPGMKDQD